MKKFKTFLLAILGVFALTFLVNAQSQLGFISIDCGLPAGDDYTDPITGINYVSDASFIDTGTNEEVPETYKLESNGRHLWNLRSFPKGIRNCYTLKPSQAKGNRFLIRARFFYGNYDSMERIPEFDVYIGPNLWTTVKFSKESTIFTEEIIHVPSTNSIQVCLVNKGLGTPLISSLELRLLKNTIYKTASGSLMLFARYDTGLLTDQQFRYKDDVYDRMWMPNTFANWESINTSLIVDASGSNDYEPPKVVMQTAARPIDPSGPIQFSLDTTFSDSQYYVYLHFAEIEKLQANQTREFNIFVNGSLLYGPVVPNYLSTTTVFSTEPHSGERVVFQINRTERSTLPPIVNAVEIYTAIEFLQSETDQQEVDAIQNIKSSYGVTKNWQGDPCVPKAYLWEGLNCSYDGHTAPKIMALNLSASGLKGEITADLAELTSIQYLNLKGNKLTGPIPDELIKRSQSGLLDLRVDGPVNGGDTTTCSSNSCGKKKRSIVAPVIASVAALVAVLIASLVLMWCLKRNRQQAGRVDVVANNRNGTIETRNRQLTYAEVETITNNFERKLGQGGFGTVYYGRLDDIEVAVKMLAHSSGQGYEQFQAEINLLMRVHHRNLTSLVGYCNEDTNVALIYEYMANGDLDSHLSDKSTNVLTWEERLRIAVDAAQGLEYLHHGCKPPIIHRDIKSTNILLDEKFQAKLADFGLSRSFSNEEGNSRISTKVAGTPGYLDPEYYILNKLHEKSDVYSYGVVLLEIVTSQPVLKATREKPHIAQWVSLMLERGDIRNIVDPRLQGDLDANSAWKMIELALSCLAPTSNDRPAMNDVVMELKICLEMELARKREDNDYTSKDSIEVISMRMQSDFNPIAR